jgi:putative oxidoreductase
MATTSAPYIERREEVRPRLGLLSTSSSIAPTIARLVLGGVMLPHALQKVLPVLGGHGWSGTMGFFTSMGMPSWLAALAILTELFASIMLIAGAFTRLAAVGIAAMMVGAIVLVHAKFGFFMNWMGQKAGEGFEYHLLAIALALVVFVMGGGAGSVDRRLTLRRRYKSM